jgi:IPT/TIG domain
MANKNPVWTKRMATILAPALMVVGLAVAAPLAALGAKADTSGTLPVVLQTSPPWSSDAGGATVVIDGTGFAGATGVAFNGIAAASFTVATNVATQTGVGSDEITAVTAPGPSGEGNITVTTPAGTSVDPVGGIFPDDTAFFSYEGTPVVSSISCCGAWAMTNLPSVLIHGSGFAAGDTVMFGDQAAVYSSSGYGDIVIDAVPPPGSGTVDVTVVTPEGTSAVNPVATYTYPTTNADGSNNWPSSPAASRVVTPARVANKPAGTKAAVVTVVSQANTGALAINDGGSYGA